MKLIVNRKLNEKEGFTRSSRESNNLLTYFNLTSYLDNVYYKIYKDVILNRDLIGSGYIILVYYETINALRARSKTIALTSLAGC